MKAGHEFNGLVAEKVMGWHKFWSPATNCDAYYELQEEGNYQGVMSVESFNPSTNISDAEKAIDKLHDKGYIVDIETSKDYCKVKVMENEMHGRVWEAEAETLALGICKASLKAEGIDINE